MKYARMFIVLIALLGAGAIYAANFHREVMIPAASQIPKTRDEAALSGWVTPVAGPSAVVIRSGAVQLRGLFWRPRGRRPFPAILFNHGSGRTREELERLGPYERQAETIGPVFARHGYAFLYLFRRGVGLSADQGASSVDLMNAELAAQ